VYTNIKDIKNVVLSYIEACGPSGVGALTMDVMVHCNGPWDDMEKYKGSPETYPDQKVDMIKAAVIDALNQLTYEGRIELYETGDAWIKADREPLSWETKKLILDTFDKTNPDDDSLRIIYCDNAGWTDEEFDENKVRPWIIAREALVRLLNRAC
jgi:hypothetical protein